MGYEAIVYEKKGRIAYITLNRPDAMNAFNMRMKDEVTAAFMDFDQDDAVFLAIVSGAGRHFSIGADFRDPNRGAKLTTSRLPRAMPDAPVNWKPVIAAVHGYCYAYGLSFAIDCDIIVATRDAKFCVPELKRGIPGGTHWARLWFWLGSKKATELAMTGDPLTAEDAHRLGMVSRLVDKQEELLPAATALAERILENPPLGVRNTAQISRRAAQASAREADMLFSNLNWQNWEDHKESVKAFLEKRKAVYKGK